MLAPDPAPTPTAVSITRYVPLREHGDLMGAPPRNIGNFGGNPRNVTIVGESAGGLSVLAQMASPPAAGLFSRAIVESGTFALTQVSQASANTSGTVFAAAAVGCSEQTAACLRSRSVEQLLAQNATLWTYRPNIDGRVLPQSISTALAGGQFNRVPLINGSNADEWRFFVALSYDLASGGSKIFCW